MKKIVGDLLKNKNVNKGLQEYYGRFMEINNKYAMIRLAMNYYTYYASTISDGGMVAPGFMTKVEEINQIIENCMNNKKDLTEEIDSLLSIRADIVERVRALTCFVDRYNIYEYVLNRVEYRFKDEDMPSGYTDEVYTRKVMQFIFEDEDGALINSKIKDVIGQLPIRLTKTKFFEMVSNGFDFYKDGIWEGLDDFVYMLRTCAMLDKTEHMESDYPHLCEAFEQLEKVTFKNITYEEYLECKDILKEISDYVDEEMDQFMMIQTVVNDLLEILYTVGNSLNDNIIKGCQKIIKCTNLLFTKKESPKSLEEIEDMFVMLEGEQEKLYDSINYNDITDYIKENFATQIKELNLEKQYNVLYKLSKLNSDSIFVQLNDNVKNQKIDDKYLEEKKNEMIEQLGELFKNNDRLVVRAVMAAILSELPMFFGDISEVQDYIYNTLSICTDKAEKLACIEIINGIMVQ